ncbi:MAG: SIMPL domain-containing protein [candidate division WOR-3 bacterium]|nr:SIMPL domain-containing protein [candidate division WOR-3 bacterium]MCX7948055.1 SIMPL domain-containing protein [candidate division WOR-3 bacterium]MDW8151007.1 SIMPL domain-containing protein [candidate division WOR-3 bacterium]
MLFIISEVSAFSITLPFEIYGKAEPDVFIMNISASIQAESEERAIYKLGDIDSEIRKNNISYKDGSYYVYKNCYWSQDREICSGYRAIINYIFELKDEDEQKQIISIFSKIKKKNVSFDYSINSVRWDASERKLDSIKNTLKIKAIRNSEIIVKEVEKEIKKSCKLLEVNIKPMHDYYFPIITSEAKGGNVPEPKKESMHIRIDGELKISCQ